MVPWIPKPNTRDLCRKGRIRHQRIGNCPKGSVQGAKPGHSLVMGPFAIKYCKGIVMNMIERGVPLTEGRVELGG